MERQRDINFAFQVEFSMRYTRGFVARPNRRGEDADNYDQRVLALLFRDKCEWAVGHNTSVQVPVQDEHGKVTELTTTQLPRYAVKGVKHETVPGVTTGMFGLSQMDGTALANALTPLLDEYSSWIQKQGDVYLERDELVKTRGTLMDEAKRALGRMTEGIQLLETSGRIRDAFKMANLAMHISAKQADKTPEDPRYTDGKEPQWRPFQLAFILLNLAAIADPSLIAFGANAQLDALSGILAGHSKLACVAILRAVLGERVRAKRPASELVWTGPEGAHAQARDTAVVLRELFESARKRVVLAGYSFKNAESVLKPLQRVMVDHGVAAHFFVDVPQPEQHQADAEAYGQAQLRAFIDNNWPFNTPPPTLYCDRRALQPGRGASYCSMHAKCVSVDSRRAFVSSANRHASLTIR